jgi:uncharacterized protein (TIGR02757 family)
MKFADNALKDFLDYKVNQYNRPEFIMDDPISIPHQYNRKEDREIAAFMTATISWGNRSAIIKSAKRLMFLMEYSPYQFIIEANQKELNKCLNFVHRTFNGSDCSYFFKSLRNIYLHHGGLETVFSEPVLKGKTVRESIVHFRETFLELEHPDRLEKHIANPAKNASAKRINMFLRWMVRKDDRGVDFGIWKSINPSQLYCPLDIHTGTVSRKLGLLNRKSDDWIATELLTQKLRTFDVNDPVKYDFALFGLGTYEHF